MTNFQQMPSFPGEPERGLDHSKGAPFASWGRRVRGHVIDYLLVAVAAVAVSAATGHHTPFNVFHTYVINGTSRLEPIGNKLVFFGIAAGVISVLYSFAFLASSWRATLGMRTVGIHLADERGLDEVRADRVAGRTALYPGLSSVLQAFFPPVGLLLLVDLLWPLWDPRNQTLHDKLVRTVVIRKVSGP